MVWARSRLLIWDYIFEPVRRISMNYVGPKPESYYKKINQAVRTVFNVPDAYVQEKEYTWEKGEEAEKFEIKWEVNKLLDTFSYITLEISLEGFVKGGHGKAKIALRPRLITEYPQDTVWQNSIVYEMLRRFWHKMFYHKKRMEYLNMGKELVTSFESDLKRYGEGLREGKVEE
jgi:asparagine synthetase B (glutamine-hydrolysing)